MGGAAAGGGSLMPLDEAASMAAASLSESAPEARRITRELSRPRKRESETRKLNTE